MTLASKRDAAMDPVTVVGMVSDLVGTYEEGLELYAKWRRKKERQNHHYRKQGKTKIYGYAAGSSGTTDALSTSFNISGPKVKEIYDIGFSIIGQEFSKGDGMCNPDLFLFVGLMAK